MITPTTQWLKKYNNRRSILKEVVIMNESFSASNSKSFSILALISLFIAIGMYLGVGITWLTAMLVSPIGRILGQTLVISFFAPIPLSLVASSSVHWDSCFLLFTWFIQ
jgi:hypothetical protein